MDIKNKRIVVKIGTSTLAYKTGHLNIRRVEYLVKILSDIKNSGCELILVTSAAIGVGMGKLGLPERPKDVPTKQACAAVGQCELMYTYDQMFSQYNHTVAQLLITKDVFEDERMKQNAVTTINRLLQLNVIPIFNENDTVATDELVGEMVYGDNDTLSAIVSVLSGADYLIILTDIDGLYDRNPKLYPDAKLVSRVDGITDEIKAMAGAAGSSLGTGGMATKIAAAEIANAHGIGMLIVNGENPENLYRIVDGEKVGTYFKAPKA